MAFLVCFFRDAISAHEIGFFGVVGELIGVGGGVGFENIKTGVGGGDAGAEVVRGGEGGVGIVIVGKGFNGDEVGGGGGVLNGCVDEAVVGAAGRAGG